MALIEGQQSVDFFISYTASDEPWAKWIAWELERGGFTYRMQVEHFPPGSRFVQGMRQWLQNASQLVAVLSSAYFKSQFASLEMHSAVAKDPLGQKRRVVPVRIEPCDIPDQFRDLVYVDLVGKSQDEARRVLLAGMRAAKVGLPAAQRVVTTRPTWPPDSSSQLTPRSPAPNRSGPVRCQFLACDVGRGLDLEGQYKTLAMVLTRSRFASQFELKPEFDVTEVNLFSKLNAYRPQVVHIAGNQNGGDVLFRSASGGEIVVPDEALAGLLSSLGRDVQLVIVDTCRSYACALRVSEVVSCTLGVKDDIEDVEAIRFYEVFYDAVAAGQSIADAHGQASAALRFKGSRADSIPQLCVRADCNASQIYLVHASAQANQTGADV
ncbi:MAG: hypothetical protein NTNFB02_24850 [Nitrospira sp.]